MKMRILLVLAFAVLSCSSNSSNVPSYSTAIQEAQDAAYEVTRAGGTSVGIALVARDRVVLASGYGMADVANSVPATANTMFPIGSVSKMFAAVAVMQLVDQGLVDLEKPLIQYLPSFKMADARYDKITVKMLLNHTSGIAGTRYTSAETTVAVPGYAEAVLASLADQRLKADPGAFAVYCNDGWTLVDPLVAAVGKISYVDWVKQKIFAPLGMTNSTFSLAPLPDGSYAKAYKSGVAWSQAAASTRRRRTWRPLSACSSTKGYPPVARAFSRRSRSRRWVWIRLSEHSTRCRTRHWHTGSAGTA
jgi:CubicO group peptidase (beta-lactamase class C family)